MADYTTQHQVEGYLTRNLTVHEAKIIKKVIGAVTNWIDRQCGRTWQNSANASEVRYFTGGEVYLFIDPIEEITQVDFLNADGTVNTTYDPAVPDYQALPLNKPTKTYLRRLAGRWPYGEGRIKVTGKWGESGGIPDDIAIAATILVSDWLSSEDKLKSESIEGYSRTFADVADHNPQVAKILDSRRRVLL